MTRAPKRDFIFIDESGDPGFRSTHFACLALHATDVGLRAVIECCASLRFFRAMFAELKPLHEDARLRPRLAEMLRTLQDAGHVKYTATYLEKARYTGWYLGVGQGTRFRNFQVRRLLEAHFSHASVITDECELVFDRHSHSSSQLRDFADYLNDNRRLPRFASVTAVDSRYVDAIQVADLSLRLFMRTVVHAAPEYAEAPMSFVRAWDVSAMRKDWRP